MLEFVITNYIIFIVIGVILLLGLFGYMMDKKKYEDYREEIKREQKVLESLDATPNVQSIVAPVSMEEKVPNDSITGQN